MYSGKNISIQEILWRVLKHPLCQDLTIETASEFTLEILKLIGAPLTFIDKTEELELIDYKVRLPNDLLEIKGVRCDKIPLRYASDTYHVNTNHATTEYTYILQNCVLIASLEKGCIEIAYKALAVDNDGFPMVPDNESYRMAIEYHIIFRYLEALWSMGKITDKVFQYYQQKRDWYVGQASSALTIANKDHLQTIMNGVNRLLIDTHAYETFYKNLGERERIKRYF